MKAKKGEPLLKDIFSHSVDQFGIHADCPIESKESQHRCCFCGVAVTGEQPVTLAVVLKDGAHADTLTAHWQRFRRQIHESVPLREAAAYR